MATTTDGIVHGILIFLDLILLPDYKFSIVGLWHSHNFSCSFRFVEFVLKFGELSEVLDVLKNLRIHRENFSKYQINVREKKNNFFYKMQ